jgi:hypothetical protein
MMHHPEYGRCCSHETNERAVKHVAVKGKAIYYDFLSVKSRLVKRWRPISAQTLLELSPDSYRKGGGGPAFRDRGLGIVASGMAQVPQLPQHSY